MRNILVDFLRENSGTSDADGYFISFVDYNCELDADLKDSDLNLDFRYGKAYIYEVVKV